LSVQGYDAEEPGQVGGNLQFALARLPGGRCQRKWGERVVDRDLHGRAGGFLGESLQGGIQIEATSRNHRPGGHDERRKVRCRPGETHPLELHPGFPLQAIREAVHPDLARRRSHHGRPPHQGCCLQRKRAERRIQLGIPRVEPTRGGQVAFPKGHCQLLERKAGAGPFQGERLREGKGIWSGFALEGFEAKPLGAIRKQTAAAPLDFKRAYGSAFRIALELQFPLIARCPESQGGNRQARALEAGQGSVESPPREFEHILQISRKGSAGKSHFGHAQVLATHAETDVLRSPVGGKYRRRGAAATHACL